MAPGPCVLLTVKDDGLQRRIVVAAIPLLADFSHNDKARDVIHKYGVTDEDLPALIEAYHSPHGKREAARLIASTRHPAAFRFLASQMGPANSDIERLLMESGPEVEPSMWPLLQDSSHIVRGMACRVLSKIGTEKSLAELAVLRDDRLSRSDARRAIEAIETREASRP